MVAGAGDARNRANLRAGDASLGCKMKTVLQILRRAALLALALPLFAACIYDPADPEGGDGIGVGDTLPDFTVTMSDGTSLGTSDLAGGVSLIMFFHTDCPDCQTALPIVQSLYGEFGAQVRFVTISREEKAGSIDRYWSANSLTLPYSAQTGRDVYQLFASSGIPRIYISDPALTVRAAFSDSPLPDRDALRDALAQRATLL